MVEIGAESEEKRKIPPGKDSVYTRKTQLPITCEVRGKAFKILKSFQNLLKLLLLTLQNYSVKAASSNFNFARA